MAFTQIAKATGNGGALTNGSSIPGTTGTAVADGAETHFNIIEGAGSGLSTITTVPNSLNTAGALMYKLHQDTSLVDFGYSGTVHTSQETDWVTEFYVNLANVPTGNCNLYRVWSDGAFATSVGILRVGATGQMTLFLGTGNTTVLSPAYRLAAGTNYAIGLEVVSAASVRLVVFTIAAGFVLTPVYDSGVVAHAIACPRQAEKWGMGTSGTGIVDMALQVKSGIGPGLASVPTNSAPAVSPGAAQTVTSTSATLSGSASDSTSVVSATWSLLSTTAASSPSVGTTSNTGGGSGTMTATATVTGLLPGTHVFRLTASDGSLSGTGDVSIYVPGSPVGPNRVVSNVGNWVAVNAASLWAAVNKTATDDTSYMETPATPSSASIVLGVEPIAAGDETVLFRARYTGTGTFTCTPKLYSGATLITTAAAPITLTSSFADYSVALSLSENAAVANRNDVRIELVATQS